jgi:hypothetical protein
MPMKIRLCRRPSPPVKSKIFGKEGAFVKLSYILAGIALILIVFYVTSLVNYHGLKPVASW